jgi:hypothetical protein
MRQYIQLIGSTAALPSGAPALTAAHAVACAGTSRRWHGRAGRAPGLPPRTRGPRPGRHRRAGCRRSCAGSGGSRRRRTRPARPRPPARSCWRRPHTRGRRAGAPARTALSPGLEHAVGAGVGDHHAARLALCCSHLAFRSAMSTLPWSSHLVTTTCMPTIWALAGLVPWALLGSGRCCGGLRRALRGRP